VPPPADAKLIYDMTGNNRWGDHAATWLTTHEAARANAEVAIVLKSMVPDDAKKAFGNGIQITRDRAGRLSLREFKDG
jgi:hypothetical protein